MTSTCKSYMHTWLLLQLTYRDRDRDRDRDHHCDRDRDHDHDRDHDRDRDRDGMSHGDLIHILSHCTSSTLFTL